MTSAVVDASRSDLATMSAEDFVSHHILDRVPWIFGDRKSYVAWKGSLAAELTVDPYSIIIVGSAALGFSLSPYKSLAQFHHGSDIDVAVVSSHHFDIAWRWLRSLGDVESIEAADVKDALKWHRKNLVFDGTIAADRILSKLDFAPQWTAAFAKAANRSPMHGRVINARIYRDFESLRSYQIKSVKNAQLNLLSST